MALPPTASRAQLAVQAGAHGELAEALTHIAGLSDSARLGAAAVDETREHLEQSRAELVELKGKLEGDFGQLEDKMQLEMDTRAAALEQLQAVSEDGVSATLAVMKAQNGEVELGLGRIIALYRPSASHWIHGRIRCLFLE